MCFRATSRFCSKVRASEMKIDTLGGNHDFLCLLVRKLEGPNDDLCFALGDDTFLVRIHEDQLELIFREWRLGDLLMSHTAQDPGRELLEKPMYGPQDDMKDLERSSEEEQEMLGPPDGEVLRNEFSQDDVHHRDEKERDNGRRHMEERARDAAGGKEQEEQVERKRPRQASRRPGWPR